MKKLLCAIFVGLLLVLGIYSYNNNLKETPARDFEEKRVVFMKMRDKYGKKCCRFIGVYQLYKSERNKEGNIERYYKRKATNISIAESLK